MLTFDEARLGFSRTSHLNLVVARSGKTFRLEAADWPVILPSGSKRVEMSSIGLWYTRNGSSRECVVVIIRQPAKQPFDVLWQIDVIADKLAEQLARNRRLSTAYEFKGAEMALKAC